CSCQKAHSTSCNTGLQFRILLHLEIESTPPPGPFFSLFAFELCRPIPNDVAVSGLQGAWNMLVITLGESQPDAEGFLRQGWEVCLLRLRLSFAVLCLALLPGAPGLVWPTPAQAQQATVAAPLQALAGEYTDPVEPDTPLSF